MEVDLAEFNADRQALGRKYSAPHRLPRNNITLEIIMKIKGSKLIGCGWLRSDLEMTNQREKSAKIVLVAFERMLKRNPGV